MRKGLMNLDEIPLFFRNWGRTRKIKKTQISGIVKTVSPEVNRKKRQNFLVLSKLLLFVFSFESQFSMEYIIYFL
jgi:hypothetical protein